MGRRVARGVRPQRAEVKGFVDTSVLVRYLVADHPALASRAAAIIDVEDERFVAGVVIAETAYVLTRVYRIPRAAVVDDLIVLLRRENIRTWGMAKDDAIGGLLSCRPSARVSFADAMVWAAARSSGAPRVFTFDDRFPADGVDLVGRACPGEGSKLYI